MEGPPRQSTSLPAVDVTDVRDDAVWNGERKDFGFDKSFVYDAADLEDSDNGYKAVFDGAGTAFNAFRVKSLDEIEADAAANAYGIYDYSSDGKAMDDAGHGKAVKAHGKGMDFSYVKSVFCHNNVSMDDVAYGKAENADVNAYNIYGICINKAESDGDAQEYEMIGSLTDYDVLGVFDDDDDAEQGRGDNIPVDGDHLVPPNIVSIEAQAHQHVDDAKAVFQKLKDAVADANDMLQRMNKPAQRISENLLSELEVSLTDSPGWFLQVMDGKDRKIAALQQQLDEVWEQHNDIAAERDELQLKLDGEPKPMGLSTGDLKKLRSLGVDNLHDLIINYRKLQIDLAVASGKQPASKSARVTVSIPSVKEECQVKKLQPQLELFQQGGSASSFSNVGVNGTGLSNHIPIPMPDKFNGKSRVDLERYFRYFDQAVEARGYRDSDKAIMVGNYIPTLQYVHDKLLRKNSSYAEIKAGLLNALGTDSSVATFTLRTALDRIKKSDDKLYKNLLEDVERQVTQAFNGDNDQTDDELKKILIRLTQEDSNAIFGSTIIPHINEDYTRLKELVLGVEAALIIKKKNDLQLKGDPKPSSSNANRAYPQYHKRSYPPRNYPVRDTRFFGGHQREPDKVVVQSSRTEVERYPSRPPPLTSPNNENIGIRPSVCYNCKKPGHYATDCSEPNTHGVRQVKHIDDLGMNGLMAVDNIAAAEEDLHLFGKKPMLDIFLDSIKVSAMLDSGASASVISEAAIGKILQLRPKGFRQITEVDPDTFMHKRLVGADGGQLNVVNCLRMPIAWGDKPSKFAKFFVVPGLQQDVLVGTNVLQDDNDWIEALSTSLKTNTTDKACNIEQSTTVINNVDYKVNVASRIVIPPRTTVFMKVEVPLKGSTILEARTEGLETGFCENRNGFSYMKYRNESDVIQVFEKGENVAAAFPAEFVSDTVAPTVDSEESIHIINDNAERIDRLTALLNLDAPGFSPKGKFRLRQLVEKYNLAFAVTDDEFGRTSVCEHTIDTGDARPIKQPARPVPLPMKHEIKSLIDSLRNQKAIEESSSEWNSPLVLVRKKDGTVRICVDYRRLNDVTRKDAYPLPNQDALLMSLKGKKIFTALDMVSGYFQIPMAASDKHKTAFSALGKLWQFLVLPQGLATSPAAFSRMMEVVFGDLVGTSLFKFLDDILIATETEEEHLEIVEEVLKRLIRYNLKLKPKKCEVAKTKLVYLGHVISAEGVAVGQDKIDKVQNFPIPTNVTQVRQFVGLASYHRKFIEGFAKIASPLIFLTRKNVAFHWDKDVQQSFETLKGKLVSAPILSQPDYEAAIEGSKPFVVWTDACKTGVGAVLTQQDDNGNFHPLFYISKACSASERNYSITQLEALAVVVAMRKLKTFVMGAKVVVRTDHQPLIGLLKKGNLSPQLIRWALELQEFQELTIQFVKGKFNVVADALSRCHADNDYGEHVEVLESVVLSVESKSPESWFDMLKVDPLYKDICEKILKVKIFKDGQSEYTVKDGFLLKTDQKGLTVKIVPREMRKLLWEEKHSGVFGGHFGTKKIKNLLRNRYYWINMGNDLAEWTKTCMQCFAHGSHRRDRPPLHPIKTDLPMQIVGMDIVEMPVSVKGYKYMLVIIDHFTKYASSYPLITKSAEEVAKVFLENWCLREQRFPRQVISDMGREFDNKLMSRIATLTNVECIFSLGYNSQFNGLSERFIQTLKKILAKRVNEAFEWSDVLPFALFAYNTVPHEATGETPHFLLHGFDALTPSEIDPSEKPTVYQTDLEDYKHQVLENLYAAQEVVREKLENYRNRMAKEYDSRKRTHPTTINLGDLVFVELPTERVKNALSKLAPRWEGPARVVEIGKTHVKVKFLHGECFKEIHLSQVVKWQGKECDAKPLKGETSRRTRTRYGVNSVTFSTSMDRGKKLSENYGCPEESCLLSIGLVLPNSPYARTVAYSCRDLAEKVTVAMSSKMTAEEKEAVFKKSEELAPREKIAVSTECLKAAWKAVLGRCPHQAEALKGNLGKLLDNFEIEELDVVYEMIAHLNNAQFMVVKNMDTVVVGGENAKRFKNAINANYFHIQSPDESELRGRVVFGSKIKTIIFIPSEKLLYDNGAKFDAATRVMLETLDYLDQCNSCNVIMLPIFRHLGHPEISQKFINWYKETAETDDRLVGTKEIDEMKLIHWLHATPSNIDETGQVAPNGILTEAGTQKMVKYLNQLGYAWKHRELLLPEKSIKAEDQTLTVQPSSLLKEINASDRLEHRGNGRGNYRGSGGRDRGFKRKVEKWMEETPPSRRSHHSNRRDKYEQ
uniref:RNA-directed DNA polymerase n=1 Tax=Panagrolaimus sp. ES5 TaxID=591445 RepID=A0AC34FI21_9BILA